MYFYWLSFLVVKIEVESIPNPISPVTMIKNYASADAKTVFNLFNTAYYSQTDKLYYSTIFVQYLLELVKVAPNTDYAKWIIFNENTAWNNRDQTRGIIHRNYKIFCPKGFVQSYESSSAVALMQLFIPTN